MRALLLVRPDLEAHPGGDTTQIVETARMLRRHGVAVELSSNPELDLRGVDIVHLFHIDRVWENVHWCQQIRATGVPSVLSPIYWPTDDFDRRGRPGLRGVVARLAGPEGYQQMKRVHRTALPAFTRGDLRAARRSVAGHRHGRRYILSTVNVLLPNSRAELAQIERRFIPLRPAIIVPNGANRQQSPPPTETLPTGPARRDSVLCVGRIEPRKNQLALIRALEHTGLQLRIVGRAGRFNRSYERQCRREAGSNIEFSDWSAPQELRRWYRVSGVHVSPSWYETPGLASLEAASCGCPIVVTPGGATREYFGDDVEYCAPNDPVSIRLAVERAMNRPLPLDLSRRIARDFTWEAAAQQTLYAYDRASKSLS